jgi:hypothetical protein
MLLVDCLNFNLLSVAQLCDLGFSCNFTIDEVLITSGDGSNLMFKGFRHEKLYLVDFSSSEAKFTTCLFSKDSLSWLWHIRIGHVGMKQLNKLTKHDLVRGLKDMKFEKTKLCSSLKPESKCRILIRIKIKCQLTCLWNYFTWIILDQHHL